MSGNPFLRVCPGSLRPSPHKPRVTLRSMACPAQWPQLFAKSVSCLSGSYKNPAVGSLHFRTLFSVCFSNFPLPHTCSVETPSLCALQNMFLTDCGAVSRDLASRNETLVAHTPPLQTPSELCNTTAPKQLGGFLGTDSLFLVAWTHITAGGHLSRPGASCSTAPQN